MHPHEKISSTPLSLLHIASGRHTTLFLKNNPALIAHVVLDGLARCERKDLTSLSSLLQSDLSLAIKGTLRQQMGDMPPPLIALTREALKKEIRSQLVKQISRLPADKWQCFIDTLMDNQSHWSDPVLFDCLLDVLACKKNTPEHNADIDYLIQRLNALSDDAYFQGWSDRLVAARKRREAMHDVLFKISLSALDHRFRVCTQDKTSELGALEAKKALYQKTALVEMEAWLRINPACQHIVWPDKETTADKTTAPNKTGTFIRQSIFQYGRFFGIGNTLIVTFFVMMNLFAHLPVVGQLVAFYPAALIFSGLIAAANAVIFWKYDVPFMKRTLGLETTREAPPEILDQRLQVKYTKLMQSRLEQIDASATHKEPLATLSRLVSLFKADILQKDGDAIVKKYHADKARKEKYIRRIDNAAIVIGFIMSGATSFFGWTAMLPVITQSLAGTAIGILAGPMLISAFATGLAALAVTTAMGVFVTRQLNRLNPEEKAVNTTVKKISTFRRLFGVERLDRLKETNERLNKEYQKQYYQHMKAVREDKDMVEDDRFVTRIRLMEELKNPARQKSLLRPNPHHQRITVPPDFVESTLAPIVKEEAGQLATRLTPNALIYLLKQIDMLRRRPSPANRKTEILQQEALVRLHQAALIHLKKYLKKIRATELHPTLEEAKAPAPPTWHRYFRWLPRGILVYLGIGGTANGLVSNFIGSSNLIRHIAILTAPRIAPTQPFNIMASMAASFFAYLNVMFYHQFEMEFLRKTLGLRSTSDIIRVYQAYRAQVKMASLMNTCLAHLPAGDADPERQTLLEIDQLLGKNLKHQHEKFVGKPWNEKPWATRFNRIASLIGTFNPAAGTFFTATAMFAGSAAIVGVLHGLIWIPVLISVSLAVMVYTSKRANAPLPEMQAFQKIGKKIELAEELRERNLWRNSYKKENAILRERVPSKSRREGRLRSPAREISGLFYRENKPPVDSVTPENTHSGNSPRL